MNQPAIPDIVTIVGSSYFQPIADLMDIMLKVSPPERNSAGTNDRENGYAASLVILLVAVMESYTARLRFVRSGEIIAGKSVPDLLADLFPDLPTKAELIEVFLLRNLVLHNHVWHLDVSNPESDDAPTLKSPIDLGFDVNKHYKLAVDPVSRLTCRLGLNANPTAVDRFDVQGVFAVVWKTLAFLNARNFSDTPLAGRTVKFRGTRIPFEELQAHIQPIQPLA